MLRYKDCYAAFEQDRLVAGNERIERVWEIHSSTLVTKSLKDKATGEEWIAQGADLTAYRLPLLSYEEAVHVSLQAVEDDDLGVGAKHWKVSVELRTNTHAIRFEVRLYPSASFLRQEMWVKRIAASSVGSEASVFAADSSNLQLEDYTEEQVEAGHDYIDALALRPVHCRWQCIQLKDVTDSHNNLVSRDTGLLYKNERIALTGSILAFSQQLTSRGLLVLKEGPTAFGHLHRSGGDFRFEGNRLFVDGSGLDAADGEDGDELPAYGVTVGVYDGTELGLRTLLHAYHRSIRTYVAQRDAYVMSNTWGDRSRDGRVNEAFILEELPAAAELGVTVYQIDDGWQQGTTANSIVQGGTWGDYYSQSDQFWEVHPERFPRGLKPVMTKAKELGMELGLWFSPDSSHDFRYWEKDADTLIGFYQREGIRHFKLDGIRLASKLGEVRLCRMMEKVIRATQGQVVFNQDTTAQVRLGYFGKTQYGNLFLENRYTDWSNYYPHYTLRNLWQLSPYVSAAKLQIEFLNVARNPMNYAQDPLAPSAVGIEFAFALTMFASPLAWMEVTGLAQADGEKLKGLIHAYKPHQQAIQGGHVLPIGEEPDGTSWTGFQSISGNGIGYVIVLREWNDREEARFALWGNDGVQLPNRLELIAASSKLAEVPEAELSSGELRVKLTAPHTFALYRYFF
ncbi:alpha-galactosidase [Paenibacillus oryzisoli]|uniref:alpha-galactosidase n=1 Tax=Paenibacillus oryzisoli TaxID=1850517 RepID=UPI003D2AFF47